MRNANEALYSKPFGEKCGIVAVWDKKGQAAFLAKKALIAVQHRGQESAGITVYKKRKGLVTHKNMGLIATAIKDEVLKKLGGVKIAIAHNRYPTTGNASIINAQPLFMHNMRYAVSIGHNGNIPDLRFFYERLKKIPKATSDTALLAALLLQNRHMFPSWMETVRITLHDMKGAFCLVILTEDGNVFAVRDQYGIRPLCFGKTDNGWVVASESAGLDAVGAQFVREVEQGEIIHIFPDGALESSFFGEPKQQKFCLFEHIYFSRADSFVNGMRVKSGREALGQKLAERIREKGMKVDIVVPIFHSGYYAAKGVAKELGLALTEAVVTSNYFGRTFIGPEHEKRIAAVNGKHNFVPDEVHGKRVLFVDDSAVRSVTSAAIVKGLYESGAQEVYAAFASPPIVNPCDLGIAMKSKSELVAARWENEPLEDIEKNVAKIIGAREVTYLSLPDTIAALGGKMNNFYSYYFGGLHPIRGLQDKLPKKKKVLPKKPRIVVFVSGAGTNLQKIIDCIESGNLSAEIVHVITNNPNAYGLIRAKKHTIKTTVIDSTGQLRDSGRRELYEKQITKHILAQRPHLIVLAGWMIVLGDPFLMTMQKKEIPVLNIHPALLTKENSMTIQTSRGNIPVIRGARAVADAYEQNLPVSGVTIHQIIPGNVFDTGPIVLREEVRRSSTETKQAWEEKMHETEHRILPTAIKRVLHAMHQGVDVSRGSFEW